MRQNQRAIFFLTIVFAMIFAFSENALAGQFTRIRNIPDEGEILVHASPMNDRMGIMETDIYEFQSDTGLFGRPGTADRFQCLIVSNTTQTILNLTMIGLNGNIIGRCTTEINGTCFMSTRLLPPNALFQCRVSGGGFGGSGVSPGRQGEPAHYILAVRRPPLAPQGALAADETDVEEMDDMQGLDAKASEFSPGK